MYAGSSVTKAPRKGFTHTQSQNYVTELSNSLQQHTAQLRILFSPLKTLSSPFLLRPPAARASTALALRSPQLSRPQSSPSIFPALLPRAVSTAICTHLCIKSIVGDLMICLTASHAPKYDCKVVHVICSKHFPRSKLSTHYQIPGLLPT